MYKYIFVLIACLFFLFFIFPQRAVAQQATCPPGYSCQNATWTSCAGSSVGQCGLRWGTSYNQGTCVNNTTGQTGDQCTLGSRSCCAEPGGVCNCANQPTCNPACQGAEGYSVHACTNGSVCNPNSGALFCRAGVRANFCETGDLYVCGAGMNCGQYVGSNCPTGATCYSTMNACNAACQPTPTRTPTTPQQQPTATPGSGGSCRAVGQSCNTPQGAGAAPCCSGQGLSCISNTCRASTGSSCLTNSDCAASMDTCQNGVCTPGGGGGDDGPITFPGSGPRATNTPTPPSTYNLTTRTYVDTNNNGQFDGSDLPLRVEVQVTRSGYSNTRWTSSVTGSTIFSNLNNNTYTATFYTPEGYQPRSGSMSSVAIPVTMNTNRTVSVGYLSLAPIPTSTPPPLATATVEGTILSNTSGECSLAGAVPAEAGIGVTINNTNGTNNGTFTTGANGNYSISVTDQPSMQQFITLSNTGNQTITCVIINGVPDTNVTGLTYGPFDFTNANIQFILNTTNPWFMTSIGSVKQRNISNNVPAGQSPTTNVRSNASVFYSTVGPTLLGSATGVSNIWQVSAEYSDNASTNRAGNASFSFYKNRAEQNAIDLKALPGCTIPAKENEGSMENPCTYTGNPNSLENKSIYYINGDFVFNPSQEFIAAEKTVIFLAEGNITLNGGIKLYKDRSLIIFAAKNDLIIGANVGNPNLTTTPVVTNNSSTFDIQAILTAENDIIIQSNTTCPTPGLRLNIEGSLIANADNPFGVDSAGGTLRQLRTLCTQNATAPALYVQSRLSFVTALTDFYKISNTFYNEVAP